MPKPITILIPTYNRPCALAVLLATIANQTEKDFDILISDQSDCSIQTHASVTAIIRLLHYHGHQVKIMKHLPRRGIAEQRQFLLENANSPYILFLDDDLILESWVIANLFQTIREKICSFVGQAAIGLSFYHDYRPIEEHIEWWGMQVRTEVITPHTTQWKRYLLHNAANVLHVQEKYKIGSEQPKAYKIAWIGACVLYNTEKLRSVGGFSFWEELPSQHSGEDALVQMRLMQKYGGCGILPSGVYHQELPTTIQNRKVNAPEFFELV